VTVFTREGGCVLGLIFSLCSLSWCDQVESREYGNVALSRRSGPEYYFLEIEG